MSACTPCYRHSAHVWIANCADCTAWHLAAQITRRSSVSPARRAVASGLRTAA